MKKTPSTPSQHEITVRDRRALNKKIAALTVRVEQLEELVDKILAQPGMSPMLSFP